MSDADRIALAKKIAAAILAALSSPGLSLLPAELRAALGDLQLLLIELAQLSHAKFDMAPFDLAELVHRVDALDGLTGEGGGVPQLRRRIEALEKERRNA